MLPLVLRGNELPFCVFDGSSGLLNTSSSLTRQFLCSVKCFRETSPLLQPAFLFVDRLFCCKGWTTHRSFQVQGVLLPASSWTGDSAYPHQRDEATRGWGRQEAIPRQLQDRFAGHEQIYGQTAERNSGDDPNVKCHSAKNRSSDHECNANCQTDGGNGSATVRPARREVSTFQAVQLILQIQHVLSLRSSSSTRDFIVRIRLRRDRICSASKDGSTED